MVNHTPRSVRPYARHHHRGRVVWKVRQTDLGSIREPTRATTREGRGRTVVHAPPGRRRAIQASPRWDRPNIVSGCGRRRAPTGRHETRAVRLADASRKCRRLAPTARLLVCTHRRLVPAALEVPKTGDRRQVERRVELHRLHEGRPCGGKPAAPCQHETPQRRRPRPTLDRGQRGCRRRLERGLAPCCLGRRLWFRGRLGGPRATPTRTDAKRGEPAQHPFRRCLETDDCRLRDHHPSPPALVASPCGPATHALDRWPPRGSSVGTADEPKPAALLCRCRPILPPPLYVHKGEPRPKPASLERTDGKLRRAPPSGARILR